MMRLDAAGSSCCDGSSWGSAGASSKGFSRVSESETESASELSVDGVDVPVDSISMPVDEGVIISSPGGEVVDTSGNVEVRRGELRDSACLGPSLQAD